MNASRRIRGRFCVLLTGIFAVAACSDSPSAMQQASARLSGETLAPLAPVHTYVTPAIVLQTADGVAVRGTRVTFEVTAGGGSLEATSAVTDGSGRAEVQWRLGTVAGANTAVARVSPTQAVTFTVQAVAGPASAMAVAASPPEVAPVSGAVGIAPAVRVTDAHGNGVAGAAVEFAVTRGGGSVSGGSARTDETGVAQAGTWTVGGVEGENELTATSQGVPPVVFTTRAVAASTGWLHLTKFAGDGTTCPADAAGCSFTVRVTDTSGAPRAGETVLWTGPGGATAATVTNAAGLATASNLGPRPLGQHTQTARLVTASDDVSFSYRIVSSGGFNVDLRFVTAPSPAVRAAFESARQRWQQVITGNLPEFALTGSNQVAANACGINHPAVNEVVDDILIFVEVVPIDGPGKILGSAGPCYLRGASGLPIMGVVKLDADDLEVMEKNGMLRDVILHEIGHVLGLGTLWSRHTLVQGAGTADPFYTGARAQPGFVLGGGTILNGVPVENTGGTGTRDSHWRQSVLGDELMTGYLSGSVNPLSVITIGALMDIGYQVNFGAADAYVLPGLMRGLHAGHDHDVVKLHEVQLPLPAPRTLW
jgi:hypothetical protein